MNRRPSVWWVEAWLLIALITASLPSTGQAEEALLKLKENWTGDFDQMVEQRIIRALVPYSKTFYFVDGADQRGLTYDLLKGFENHLNTKQKRETLRIHLIVIPTPRDRLITGLLEGRGDIAAGNLTITEDRRQQVDFCNPIFTGVDEIVVTGPGSPQVETLTDLAGMEIHVRKSSSYHESLLALNARFRKKGLEPVKIMLAEELLEDEDLLEMLNAGLIPMVVIDSHKGEFWIQIFEGLTLHPQIKLRTEGEIAWAIRPKSPGLKTAVNDYVATVKKGTLTGNILFKKYLQNTKWVRRALNQEGRKRLSDTIEFFRKYADRYDFDWLMIAAQAYQESGIDQTKRSPLGAVGVMQVLPSTASDSNVNIPNIEKLENNIHAGIKYLWFLRDRYFQDEPMDDFNKMLFSFAAYNAGPARIRQLREEARRSNLDPDVWFRNVEVIAARRIGRETVQYVSNIFKYYVAYRLLVDKSKAKAEVIQNLQ
jgi:membrane-bound lytic murein transglycosylase MltF